MSMKKYAFWKKLPDPFFKIALLRGQVRNPII